MLRIRRYASTYAQAQILRKYPVGSILHGYEVKRVLPIPDLKLTAVDLVHNQTGSEHLHIDREDSNNVFSIAFKTNPPDATGVPHILEHTTLCGSNKYPVHDPFFKMLNKSIANFMNAMTGPDYTFFPFATTNAKDFANLREVYLDSTLNPLLSAHDFYQEGWRLENKNLNDPKSDLVFKGVVYNEMKGQISNADYYFWSKFQQSLYPSLNNSGGDPKFITDLSYQDLIDFHSKHYHPSNSRTFTYGNFPLVDTLERLNKEFVGFGRRNKSDKVLMPIELKDNVTVNTEGQFDQMLPSDKQTKTSMTWICGSPKNVYDSFLLKILGNVLMDGQSSVMYQKLIESGIGSEFSVNSGAESSTAVNLLTIGVQGVTDLELFRATVNDVFKNILEEKIDPEKIDGIIQMLELTKKDHKPDFGLQLLYSILPGWSNSVDPLDSLSLHDTITRFKEEYASLGDEIFRRIIRKYIYQKPCFQFTMNGSETFSSQLDAEEAQRLSKKIKKLNDEDKNTIYKRGLDLKKKQDKVEDLSCLPSLKIDDIPKNCDLYPIENMDNTIIRLTDTNGISYIRGKRSLNDLIPKDLYPYLPLFGDCLTSLGTSTQPFKDIENEMKLNTGGISASIGVSPDILTLKPILSLEFDGWALNSKVSSIFKLWEKLLINTDFEKNRETLKVLIRMMASSSASSVSESGHVFARGYTAAHYSTTKSINETLSGIEQLQFIMMLNSILDDESLFQSEVIDKLNYLKSLIINSSNNSFFITTDTPATANKIKKNIQEYLTKLPNNKLKNQFTTSNYPLLCSKKPTVLSFPFQTHYAAMSKWVGIPYTHKDSAPLQVLSSLLSSNHLHKEIRERNGAYGAGTSYDAMCGVFNFFTYRDPNPLGSLKIFEKDFEFNDSDVDNGKLRLFQSIDAPISRRGEAAWNFDYGITDHMRQERRERILNTSLTDVKDVMNKYLVGKPGIKAIVGPVIEKQTVEPDWEIKSLE